jgi:hypothetical protein
MSVNNKLWVAIVGVTCILGYLLGHTVSSRTGVEPGFFAGAESGGYGVTAEKKGAEGLSDEMQDYYKALTE